MSVIVAVGASIPAIRRSAAREVKSLGHSKGRNSIMSIGRILACVPATLAIASITPDAHSFQEAWNLADVEYQEQRFDSALARYEQLAATGDPRAAELAGQMLLFGESLYGGLVPRNRERAARWLEQAAAAGRPVARYLLDPSSARHRIASK